MIQYKHVNCFYFRLFCSPEVVIRANSGNSTASILTSIFKKDGMSTETKFVYIYAFPEFLLAILVNQVSSAKELTAAVVTPPRACFNFTFTYICISEIGTRACMYD
jgi:hypothetical protein